MPRMMSFALTTEQHINKTKTVTRRLGWAFLKPGDIVQGVKKAMGLKKGEKVEKLHLIRILCNQPEPLNAINKVECIKEGFPDMEPEEFVKMFCKHNKIKPDEDVNRIEYDYI